jgi:hypothetical protein
MTPGQRLLLLLKILGINPRSRFSLLSHCLDSLTRTNANNSVQS